MKTIAVIGTLSLVLLSTQAFADWAEDFLATFASSGVDPAVEEAFEAGVTPLDIVKMTQQTGDVAPAAVVKALYCAGVSGSTVQAVAREAGVAESDVAAGYRQSIAQCAPAAALNPDPFSRTTDIAAQGSPVSGAGEPPQLPPGIEGGGGAIVIPPSVSPDRF